MGKQCKVLTEAAPDGNTQWMDGEIVGEWNRSAGFRTNDNPEGGGPVVKVAGTIYRDDTFRATWEQVKKA